MGAPLRPMRFAILDIETRIDKRLLREVLYRGQEMDEEQAYLRMNEELGGGFAPTSLHVPISIAVGNVSEEYVLESVTNLAAERESEDQLVREFWRRAEQFTGCLVTFNGRGFDLPVLELHALRRGIRAPVHFAHRSRWPDDRHLDLQDFLTNRGDFRIRGGLDLLLKSIGLPGKTQIDGSKVQELYEGGHFAEIDRYCRSDVIQTYFLFLRVQLLRGKIDHAAYSRAREASSRYLAEIGAPADAGRLP
ncbi:MAG TPA: ribonuclease H-like domain-containing protein [Candidatus Binataceae bacterium]|nr:ribonuclease H-like domain-containing protein [Candidatus Binataceae bacterium]